MTIAGKPLFWIVAVLFMGMISGCQDQASPSVKTPPTVSVISMTPTKSALWVNTYGQTQGIGEIELRSQVSGVLERLEFSEGERVRVGQVLFRLDPEPFKAALEQAQAEYQLKRTELDQAKRDWERAKALIDVKAVSRKDYEEARTQYLSAQAALKQARAKENLARVNLQHCTITAPVDGVIGQSALHVGSLINQQTTLLGVLTQPESLRVHFAVADTQLIGRKIQLDYPVFVSLSDKQIEVPATLDYIASRVDPKLGTLAFRAKITDAHSFFPGQFVSVRLMLGALNQVYKVPQKAVRQKPDGTYAVFIYQDGKAHERAVKVSHWEGKDWVITNGLKPKDEVIIDQQLRLRDQLKVKKHSLQEETL